MYLVLTLGLFADEDYEEVAALYVIANRIRQHAAALRALPRVTWRPAALSWSP